MPGFFVSKSQREVTEDSPVLLCLLFFNFSFLFRSLLVPHHKEAGRWCRMAPKMDDPLWTLLTGSEGQAAVHQHPDVVHLSLLFYSPPPQQLSPGAETNLFYPSSNDSFAAEKSNRGSRDRSIACSQRPATFWGGNVCKCAAGKSIDGERRFPNLDLPCSTYMMQPQPFHKHIFRLWVKFRGGFAVIPEACLIYSYFPPEHMEGDSSSVNNIWKQRHYVVRDSHNIN